MKRIGEDPVTLDPGTIEALYTDMGDVLVKVRSDRFFGSLSRWIGPVDRQGFVDRVLAREVYTDFARGLTPPETFAHQMADILGIHWNFKEFREVWVDMFDPIPGAEVAFETALSKVPVFILSNTDPVHWEYLLENHGWLGRATETHLSFDVGSLKPDPGYYLGALSRFGHEPGRVVFIDDRPENVRAAAAVGLIAVHQSDDSVFNTMVSTLWGR